jgi:chemotaxis protein MotB
MADKEPIIVIKKITIVAAGGHGGSWKVAFADFMTAMMAFFLVMWLLNQTEEVKKNVSDYFSTPSVIEYNFSNFGVELTLEKIFLDLVNEPLKVLQDFMQPMDYTPNFMKMGSQNMVKAAIMEQLGDYASEMNVSGDTIEMEIPEKFLFQSGTAEPLGKFADVAAKLQAITMGLEDAHVYVDSKVYLNTFPNGDKAVANKVAEKRLDLVMSQLSAKLEHNSVELHGKKDVKDGARGQDGRPKEGAIHIRIKQKDELPDGSKPRKLGRVFGKDEENLDVYNNFVNKVSHSKAKATKN